MTSEAPRRRASDHSVSSPRVARMPEPARTDKPPENTVGESREAGFYHVGSGRANASRERRQRDMEWHGPERRISSRL
jgi:hypothetical protein